MATYAIGDIQGCFDAFMRLLEQINFGPQDQLWLAGDLVNRGPDNVSVLRYVRGLGDRARTVLGNHDLHLLAIRAGYRKIGRKDTVQDLFEQPDCDELLDWLQTQPLLVHEGQYTMAHAGIPHIWGLDEAISFSREVHVALAGPNAQDYFAHMYGNQPNFWSPGLCGPERLRVITNYLTRMRFIAADGSLNLDSKQGPDAPPENMQPWFTYPSEMLNKTHLLFGHWAALEGRIASPRLTALDTGCVWGGCLSALRLEDGQRFQINCAGEKL